MSRRDVLAKLPEVSHTAVPSIALGEEAELGRRSRGTPVSAMVVRVHGVALSTEGFRYPRVAAGVLTPPVGDLYDRFGRFMREPAIHEEHDPVWSLETERRRLHLTLPRC